MKKFTLQVLLVVSIFAVHAQTSLKPGDVAIVQVNFSQNSFDFVPLVDIAAGTKIKFTDYAWKNSLKGFDKTTQYDTEITYTAPSNIAKGTVIQTKNNIAFDNNSVSFYSKNAGNTYLKGENLIAFQINSNDTVFLSAFGWMRKDNFSVNPSNSLAKVCDIPPGLSKENFTVIQMDSLLWGQNATLQRDFRYNKYDGFTGTASKIRYWLSNTSNYDTFSGYYNNDAVSNFTVLAPDVTPPVLTYAYPANNKLNTSIHGIGILKFDEPVIALKSLILKDISTNQIIKTYTIVDLENENDSTVKFKLYPYLEKNTSYSLSIPKDFVKDYDGNTWPSQSITYNFATSANKSTIECCFPDNSGIIINPYFSDCAVKDNLRWTTIRRTSDEYGHVCMGYFSWTMSGLPMKYYTSVTVESDISIPDLPTNGMWSYGSQKLVVDLTSITHNITDVVSHVYDNNSAYYQKSYSGGNLVNNKSFSGLSGDRTGYMHFENENSTKLDSIVFYGYEGRLISFKMEVIDKFPPVVELGNSRVVCEGDSVQLDTGLTLGALYDWNTGAKTQKIWVKTSGTYSVTVKNSLGQASDNVQVTVKPAIVLTQHPDTIFACVGETITLTPVQNTEFTYLWSPTGETTSTINVTKSGNYKVLISNGSCLKVDSIVVKYSGASLRAFFNQGGMTGFNDVQGELYKKEIAGQLSVFKLYKSDNMPQFVQFDSLPMGEYLFKAHFVDWTFAGQNSFMDTYHDGKTTWTTVTPFRLNCETDTLIFFSLANKPVFEFNGTGVISGKIQIVTPPSNSPIFRIKSAVNNDCDTRIVLYNATGDVIATTCPDAEGNYSFVNLPAGNYSVGIERTGFEVQSVFTASVNEGETISNADFTIDEEEQTVIQGITTDVPNVSNSTNLKLNLVPNPALDFTNLEFEMPAEGEAIISITDLTGRMLQKENVLVQVGKNRFSLRVSQLSGVYFVKIATVAGSSTAQLIVR